MEENELSASGRAQETAEFGVRLLNDWLDRAARDMKDGKGADKVKGIMDFIIRRGAYADTTNESEAHSQEDIRDRQLKEDEEAFAKEIDSYTDGSMPNGHVVNVMATPLVFSLANAEMLPMVMAKNNIAHILDGRHSENIDPEILKGIPRALTGPMMIFDSKEDERIVAILDINDKSGDPIIVPIVLNAKMQKGRKVYEINQVINAYGKEGSGWYENWIEDGLLRYYDTKKTDSFAKRRRLSSPAGALRKFGLSDYRISTERDLVKLKKQKGNKKYYR
ncbi:MAG: hypothetical protein LBL63_00040 [Clostridiales Family XIII bacterium]|jgi:hypothetical protein|nr:hypothetical protein [Clostridiales Family XIII bacterium]